VELVGRGKTDGQPLPNWQSRRRIALAVDRQTGRITVGVTGARSLEIGGTFSPMTDLVISSGTGSICRVTGFPEFRGTDQLEGLVA
jgi:hypothetical protein